MALSVVLLTHAYLLPAPASSLAPAPLARRAVLHHAATTACSVAAAVLSVPTKKARADLADLDDGYAAAKPVPVATRAADSGDSFQVLTLTEGSRPKRKMSTPAMRIKELEEKRDKTDKEKKELRRLKSEEMCELLGRGC